jgi:hypothetical protein
MGEICNKGHKEIILLNPKHRVHKIPVTAVRDTPFGRPASGRLLSRIKDKHCAIIRILEEALFFENRISTLHRKK